MIELIDKESQEYLPFYRLIFNQYKFIYPDSNGLFKINLKSENNSVEIIYQDDKKKIASTGFLTVSFC